MICVERKLLYNRNASEFKITPIGDVHVGNKATCKRTFRKVIAEIEQNPNHYWFGIGDYFDAISKRDKRFRIGTLDPKIAAREDTINAQVHMLWEMIIPITSKCLGLLRGNHEDTVLERDGVDLAQMLADRMAAVGHDVQVFGYEGWLRLKFQHSSGGRSRTIDIFASHGHGGGRKPGAKVNRLVDIFSHYHADFVIVGHTHDMLSHVSPYITPDIKGNIKNKHHVGMVASSFLKKHTDDGTTTYVEKKGLPPVALGHSWISYNPITDKRHYGFWVEND